MRFNRRSHFIGIDQVITIRVDHDLDRQSVLARELKVALVMGWHCHDGAGAVAHQHVICDPDRDMLTGSGVDGIPAGEYAGFLTRDRLALDVRLALGLLLVGTHFVQLGGSGDFFYQRVLGGEHHEGHTPERVGAGGEDLNRVTSLSSESDGSALRLPDPLLLQGFNQLRPIEPFIVQQLLGIGRGLEEPLFQVFADHGRAAAFAVAVVAMHLLTRQGRVAVGAEVHRGHLLVCQPVFVELLKEPLRPAVILRIRRNDLRAPVEGVSHRAELSAHTFDVGIGPRFWVDLVLDRGVFRWQTKSIKTHREEDVVTLHALETRACVRRRHGIPVTDVEVA